MTETLRFRGELTVVRCWCGLRLAIPSEMHRWAHEDTRNAVWCPSGHQFVFRESEADALRARLDQAEAAANDERQKRKRAEERERAVTGEVTRTRKRLAGGVCPCCNRSFEALARHMRSQHPEYVDAVDVPASVRNTSAVDAVHTVVKLAGEPMRPEAVLGRLVLAGRRFDTAKSITSAMYNAETAGRLRRVAPKTWVANEEVEV